MTKLRGMKEGKGKRTKYCRAVSMKVERLSEGSRVKNFFMQSREGHVEIIGQLHADAADCFEVFLVDASELRNKTHQLSKLTVGI